MKERLFFCCVYDMILLPAVSGNTFFGVRAGCVDSTGQRGYLKPSPCIYWADSVKNTTVWTASSFTLNGKCVSGRIVSEDNTFYTTGTDRALQAAGEVHRIYMRHHAC